MMAVHGVRRYRMAKARLDLVVDVVNRTGTSLI